MIIGKVFWFIWVIGKSREGRRNTSFFNGQIIVCTDSKSDATNNNYHDQPFL